MANRKKLDTGPKLDGGVSNYGTPTSALHDRHIDTVVRLIKRGRLAQVEQVNNIFSANMKRLRLRSRKAQPVAGVPDGSDQVDVQTIAVWAGNITKNDKPAKEQLVKLMATVKQRLS